MTSRTGLPPVELDLLRAVRDAPQAPEDADDPVPAGPWHRCPDVLTVLAGTTGIGSRYGYPMLCDLVRPWRTLLPLLTGQGNYGSQDGDPAAEARYTDCGLSPAGEAALAAEDGTGPPLPLGLVNGSWYRDGVQPPFAPAAVAAAVLAAAEGDPAAGARALGTPVDVGGCAVAGDLDRLLAGAAVRLILTAPIRRERGPRGNRLIVSGLPPGSAPAAVAEQVENRSRWQLRGPLPAAAQPDPAGAGPTPEALPVFDVLNESTGRVGVRLVLDLEPDADVAETVAALYGLWSFRQQVDARLPAPAEQLLADWVAAHGAEQAAAGARVLAGLPVPGGRYA